MHRQLRRVVIWHAPHNISRIAGSPLDDWLHLLAAGFPGRVPDLVEPGKRIELVDLADFAEAPVDGAPTDIAANYWQSASFFHSPARHLVFGHSTFGRLHLRRSRYSAT